MNHIFFECVTAKYIWSLMAFAFGVSYRPGNFDQYWEWIEDSLPQGQKAYAMGLAAVCWAIWKTRYSICFDQKRVKTPTEIVCIICSFIAYWAGLFKEKMEAQIIQGADTIKAAALFFHEKDMEKQAQGDCQLVPYVG